MVRINRDESTASPEAWGFDLDDILGRQRAAFNAAPNTPWAARKAKLQKLGKAIEDHADEFRAAISDDFGHRAFEETTIAELLVIKGGLSHAIKHTPQWMRTRKAPTALQYKPASNRIIPQPLGVIGIISPWNYPLQLAIMPLIGALGAGNRAMIKPSEYTPRFADLLKRVLASIFTDDEVFVAPGGVEVAQAFSALPFDHLVFTGSTSVGRIVAQAAAKNLTPVTLELGGKSPTIIDDSANMDIAVGRITNGKLLNAGQTCVAPDYVLMPQAKINDFSEAMLKKAEAFYPTSVVASETLDHAINYVQSKERPLALYWFGENKAKRERVLTETISGGVSINETAWHVVQEDIPFGGVGPSGMGAYHGEAGFASFSHMKGVYFQSRFSQGKNLFPPYGPKTEKLLKLMMKII